MGAPKNSGDFNRLQGGVINIENGAYVQGSSEFGGLQPDYIINFDDPALKEVLNLAKEIGLQSLPFWQKVNQVKKLVGERTLKSKSYTNRKYLALMKSYRNRSEDIPLSAYIEYGGGVCRENGMLLHLALKAAKIANNYVYARAGQQTDGRIQSEDHGFTVLSHEGKNWIIDSYNSNFDGVDFESLLKPEGVGPNDLKAPFTKPLTSNRIWLQKILNYPTVWNPKLFCSKIFM